MNQYVQLEYSTPLMKARALIPYEKRKENFANTERKWERKDIKIFWLIELIDLYMKQGLYTPFPNSVPKPS